MDGATRGGTAEPTSRDQNLREERGQAKGNERVTNRRKILSRKKRRRGKAGRRLLRQSERRNRARARGQKITVATHNVPTMEVDGTHGVGRALDVLSVWDRLECDVISLQETRRSGHSAFNPANLVYCSGKCGHENGGNKGQGGAGLAVSTSITRAARPPEFISDHLLKVILELRGRAKAVTFFCGVCSNRDTPCCNKHCTLDDLGQSGGRGTQTLTAVRVDGCQCLHRERGEGRGRKKG